MDIVKTGITGLDRMLYGGIPSRNQIVIAGGPGTGKTLLSFEYLYRNAKAGNVGILFSLEEETDMVLENAKTAFNQFTDIDDLINEKKLIIHTLDPAESLISYKDAGVYEYGKVIGEIQSMVEASGAKHIVIDSSSILDILIKDPVTYRSAMLAMAVNFRRIGVTSFLTSEMTNPEKSALSFKPEYFIFDGIITMYQMSQEQRRIFALEIIKMRGARHSFVTAPYEITSNGFKIYTADEEMR